MVPPPTQPSLLRQAWYKWMSLQLPWRKRILIGYDLHQNLFFEFADLNAAPNLPSKRRRMRRIMQPSYEFRKQTTGLSGSYQNYSEVSGQLSPAWHQWLRHTRAEAPSLREQVAEVQRQEELKRRVEIADRRWREGARLESAGPVKELKGHGAGKVGEQEGLRKETEGPWKRARGGPSETWQPEAWSGAVSKRDV